MKKGAIWIFIAIVLVLFVFSSYLTNQSLDFFKNNIHPGLTGMLLYILIIILEIIFAPVSIVPLIPVASAIWGWQLAGVLTLFGWTVGSLAAFIIARRGVHFFEKRYTFEKIRRVEGIIPEKNVFLGLILLRITLPFDLISYAIGFFSGVDWKVYTLASFIGFIPLAFTLAYLGTFSLMYQIILFILGILIVIIFIKVYHRDQKLKKKVTKFKHGLEKKFKE